MQRLFVDMLSTRGCHTHSPHDVLVSDSLSIPEKHGCRCYHMPHVHANVKVPIAPPVPLTAIPVPAAVELRSPVTGYTKIHLSLAHLNVETRLQITFTGEQIGGRALPTTERQAALGILAMNASNELHTT